MLFVEIGVAAVAADVARWAVEAGATAAFETIARVRGVVIEIEEK